MIISRVSCHVVARRWPVLVVCALSVGLALITSGPAASQQPGAGAADPDVMVIDDLVKANHILAKEGVLDGFGHVSARSLKNPKHFYLSRSLAPALVTAGDILEFDENSRPVDQPSRQLYSERFIHGEMLRARPDVMAVVHSHSPDVLPFTVTNAPFKALIHMAGFLGSEPAPVFDTRTVPGGGDFMMLVTDATRGAALAKVLGARSVVLMRGHGMTVAAPSVRQAVLRAIYTQINARVETKALLLGTPNFLDDKEVRSEPAPDRPWEVWVAESEH
jgi:ribulose-5-phosphate 4-epimerase/fuculose-1-phosphate aldolase